MAPHLKIGSLIEEGATVQVRCVQCGRTLCYQGAHNIRLLGPKSLLLFDLQRRLRCGMCRGRAELIITMPQTTIEAVRKVASVIPYNAQKGGALGR